LLELRAAPYQYVEMYVEMYVKIAICTFDHAKDFRPLTTPPYHHHHSNKQQELSIRSLKLPYRCGVAIPRA
jgi:hypothetical protein